MSKADDLQIRIEIFVDAVVDFCEAIPIDPRTARFVDQLTGSANSLGANYRAARRARSHAEFTAKIGVVSEEADESEFWLARAIRHRRGDPNKAALLHAEALELTKILGRSAKTARSRRRQSRDQQSPNRAITNRSITQPITHS